MNKKIRIKITNTLKMNIKTLYNYSEGLLYDCSIESEGRVLIKEGRVVVLKINGNWRVGNIDIMGF